MNTSYENVVELKNINKKYEGFEIKNLNMVIPKGCVMGFVGQNGAGKSTTMRILMNLIAKNSGEVRIFGKELLENEKEIKENTAVVFDENPLPEEFKAKQVDIFMNGLYKNWDKKVFYAYLERLGLPTNKRIGQFSKGMKMKMQLAVALSHKAKLLVMDEPTTGLDPVVRNEVLELFRDYLEQDEEHSILLSSHITTDLEKIADCITFIDQGKVILSGYKDELLENHGILKCSLEDAKEIEEEDYISVRKTEIGAEFLVGDRELCKQKYSGCMMENTNLEEIMLYYINRDKKEW